MSGDITQLLQAWHGGDAAAFDALVPMVYQELHRVAAAQMRAENAGHTLSTTALLHESLLKLMQSNSLPEWQNRKHLYVVAARAMRRLLVDHARKKRAAKRDAGPLAASLPDSLSAAPTQPAVDVIDLDRVLASLYEESPRRAQMLELRYFGGLDLAEIATISDCSLSTVSRELRFTEAWLAREIRGAPPAE
jgi:RNA polymerase sigma factor (TIGR02999 family)